jgi:hypothetical protein
MQIGGARMEDENRRAFRLTEVRPHTGRNFGPFNTSTHDESRDIEKRLVAHLIRADVKRAAFEFARIVLDSRFSGRDIRESLNQRCLALGCSRSGREVSTLFRSFVAVALGEPERIEAELRPDRLIGLG